MVNRTKIPKEISRRTGGISQKTGKGKPVKQINIWKDKWEQIPGTGTSPYNPPKYRLKEEPDLPIKRQTKKPIGAGPKDVKKSKKPPRGPRIKTIPVKTKRIDPPSDYGVHKKHQALRRQGVTDAWKHKELQEKMTADERAAAKLAEKKRKRESGEYDKLFKKGGKVKKKKYSAGGRISYQGHDGNKFVSKYYS
tara:strand:- start:2356 stop:2937 length:582 start_codon:yes stop_codon:yes gene_type:complete